MGSYHPDVVTPSLPLRGSRDPRRAYRVVDLFESELADYTGARFAVAVNSCTNALLLALAREFHFGDTRGALEMPRYTYIWVLQSALNAGWNVVFRQEDEDYDWQQQGHYRLNPTSVIDSARKLRQNLCVELNMVLDDRAAICLSFHSAKQLPLGRGGAILTNDRDAYEWYRAARMDGRAPGDNRDPVFPAWHCPMPPDVAARGLDVLSRWQDANYSPCALPRTEYPDLTRWYPS